MFNTSHYDGGTYTIDYVRSLTITYIPTPFILVYLRK